MRIAKHVRDVQADNGAVGVLHLKTREWYFLNPAAGLVWIELRKGLSLEEACHVTAARFGVSPSRLKADLQEVIEQLVAASILTQERQTCHSKWWQKGRKFLGLT